MKYITLLASILIFVSCKEPNNTKPDHKNQNEISFFGADSLQIFGDLYETNKEAATILLFHQGGSNARAEYHTIIPKLTQMGYNILAVDLFLGGQRYGTYNRTIAGVSLEEFKNPTSYCDDFENMVATLNFAKQRFQGDIIVWGSSYSATLSIQLGSEKPDDVSGVLAFSPAAGGPMGTCQPDPYIEQIEVPLIILKPPSEMASENTIRQFELAQQHGHQTYAAEVGVHGSSMLVPSRVEGDISKTWIVVTNFLESL